MDLGKNILTFRKKLKLSQEKLGDEIGVTRRRFLIGNVI